MVHDGPRSSDPIPAVKACVTTSPVVGPGHARRRAALLSPPQCPPCGGHPCSKLQAVRAQLVVPCQACLRSDGARRARLNRRRRCGRRAASRRAAQRLRRAERETRSLPREDPATSGARARPRARQGRDAAPALAATAQRRRARIKL